MSRISRSLAVTALAALAATPLAAQSRGSQGVPPGHLPPAGMCRIWYDGVPPGRQPAPMSCAEAERRAPRSAHVIYGPRTSRGGGWDDGRSDGRRDDRRDGRWDDRRTDRRTDDWDYRSDGRWDDRDEGRRRTGQSDARRRSDGWCEVRDRAGRCMAEGGLPRMLDTRTLQQNRQTREVEQWVGSRAVRARFTDADRDGWPEQIWWLDAQGRVLQQWIDDDRSGRATRVVLYENGRAVRVVT